LGKGKSLLRRGEWYSAPLAIPTDWAAQWQDLGKLASAFLLALPVGRYREEEAHSIGNRTFPLLAMANCGHVLPGGPPYSMDAQSRIIQGLVGGDPVHQRRDPRLNLLTLRVLMP
jgi:hypothetical protein